VTLFTPRLEFSPDPLSDTTPTWTDITSDLVEIQWWSGKHTDLGDPEPGGMQCKLNNTGRRFEPDYVAGSFYPNIDTERRFRLSFDTDGPQGIEFWGDFEQGADGTAPEWTVMNGFLECKAGAEARQLQFKTTPTPRLGARIGRFEVAPGDQFGATSGERCEVRRGTPNGGFGTGNLEGQTVYTQFSTRFQAPWVQTGEVIFQQTHDSGSTYGAPMFRWRIDQATATFHFRVVTGLYPNSTDAGNGVNAGTDKTHVGRAFLADQWWDFRHAIYYTTGTSGWYIAEMRKDSESDWTRVATVSNVRTLPSYPGSGATSQFDKQGVYRGSPDAVNTLVAFHDGYQVGHSWTDVAYPTSTPEPEWNQITWDSKPNSADNPDFEVDIVGTSSAGGGTTTRTWDTTRAKFGSGAVKAVTNGAASGQGVFHTQRSGSRFTATAGNTYTAAAWGSGDGFETWRVGIEWFDGGGASISTTFCPPRAFRTDFRHLYVTAVAPGGAATARVRTSLSGTAATTFWIDGVGFWEGTYGVTYTEGLWYAEAWELDYPGMQDVSQVTVTAVDGMGLLAADTLDLLDPPDASSYQEVVSFDQPSFYYRLGEPDGTKLVSHVRRKKRKGKDLKRKFRTRETRSEVEGVSGPSGTYKNTPLLGEPGAILGDHDTAVSFRSASSEYAKVLLDAGETIDRNRVTVECWAKPIAATNGFYVSGPWDSNSGRPVWALQRNAGVARFIFAQGSPVLTTNVDGTTTLNAGTWYHLVGTFDGSTGVLYVNGVEEGRSGGDTSNGANLGGGTLSTKIISLGQDGNTANFGNVTLDEVAVYEKALSAQRIQAHYIAGTARGFAEELTGTRIASIVSSPLWSTGNVEAGKFFLQPTMKFGQGKLDEIVEATQAERPRALLYFGGSGDPVFKDFDSLDGATNDLTLGDVPGEIGYTGIDLIYDNEVFNTVTGSTDGGEAITATDSQSVSDRKPRTRDSESSLPLRDDADVTTIVNTIVNEWSRPAMRPAAVGTVGTDSDRVAHILGREIGDRVRIKRRGEGGTPIDRQTFILGYRKTLDANRILSCTWQMARGFNAADGDWHLGVPGYTELNSTTVLG